MRIRQKDSVSTTASRELLIPLAGTVVAEHVAALEPLAGISQRSAAHPPALTAGVDALLHLHRARAQISSAIAEFEAALILGGVGKGQLSRALGIREETLQKRTQGLAWTNARGRDLRRIESAPGWAVAAPDAPAGGWAAPRSGQV